MGFQSYFCQTDALEEPSFQHKCLLTITEPSTSPLPRVTASTLANSRKVSDFYKSSAQQDRRTASEGRELTARQARSHPCSRPSDRLRQWSLPRRDSKAEGFNNPNSATVLRAMALPLLGGRFCSAGSCIWLQLTAMRLLKWRTAIHILMWQIYSATLGSALHRRNDTDHGRSAPRKQSH